MLRNWRFLPHSFTTEEGVKSVALPSGRANGIPAAVRGHNKGYEL